MKRLYLPLLLFLLLALEGVFLNVLPIGSPALLIVPHFILIVLVFITLFYDTEATHIGVLYGLVFGLLLDIVYTGVLGVYMFGYAIVVYALHRLKSIIHINFYIVSLLSLLSVSLVEVFIYLIYTTTDLTAMGWGDYLANRLLPTVLVNGLFAILLYPLLANRLRFWSKEKTSKKYYL